MARYTGPKNKKNRRFGLPLKNGKPDTKRTPTGRTRRLSEYGIQLREKQKAKYIYGILERQFRNYYVKASNLEGVTGDRLMQLLENRLDNVVYRLGFAKTREQARQYVGHGHIRVNLKKVDIPSYQVKTGDQITWRERSQSSDIYKNASEGSGFGSVVPTWLNVDSNKSSGEVMSEPKLSDVEIIIDTRLIVEFYSR
jgi:small subunit ribosomal protein S4